MGCLGDAAAASLTIVLDVHVSLYSKKFIEAVIRIGKTPWMSSEQKSQNYPSIPHLLLTSGKIDMTRGNWELSRISYIPYILIPSSYPFGG
jgi:hypothetical protein